MVRFGIATLEFQLFVLYGGGKYMSSLETLDQTLISESTDRNQKIGRIQGFIKGHQLSFSSPEISKEIIQPEEIARCNGSLIDQFDDFLLIAQSQSGPKQRYAQLRQLEKELKMYGQPSGDSQAIEPGGKAAIAKARDTATSPEEFKKRFQEIQAQYLQRSATDAASDPNQKLWDYLNHWLTEELTELRVQM